MKTFFPKVKNHIPLYFLIDAKGLTLGRLATIASKILRGKESSFFTPGMDQGNFVIIINAQKILISGNKEVKKAYYRNFQRPGSLKIEIYKDLKKKFPSRILEKAIYGMLPKGILGRKYYKRLYIYSNNEICYKNKNSIFLDKFFLEKELIKIKKIYE